MYTLENQASWSGERVSALKKLWLDGLSASQIASQLGGVTRNAVLGKIHRLGLSERAVTSKPSRPVRSLSYKVRPESGNISNRTVATKPSAPAGHILESKEVVPGVFEAFTPEHSDSKKQVAMSSASLVLLTEPGSATLLTLSKFCCKWPIGDPAEDTFTMCGRKVNNRGPYCTGHAQLAYHTPTPKARASEIRGYRRFIAL